MQYQERHCNSPEPAFGGNFCSGNDKKFRYCLEGDCECKLIILDISSLRINLPCDIILINHLSQRML